MKTQGLCSLPIMLMYLLACDEQTQQREYVDLGIIEGIEMGIETAGTDAETSAQAGFESSMDAWVTIGTGFRRYEPLMIGQDVPIIAGIQGGFHVWGGFIGVGFNDVDIRVIYSLVLEGKVMATADYTEFELPKNNRGEFEYAGVSVIYFRNEDVETTSGQLMTLKLRVETQEGAILTDEQTLVPRCCE